MPKAPALEYEVGNRSVRLSSPDKVYFPQRGYTKRDVFEYYLAVGEPMLRAYRIANGQITEGQVELNRG